MSIIVGRNSTCDIVINDTSVSGEHIRASLKNGQLHIDDLGSANGTFVNDKQIQSTVVTQQDIIYLGRHRISYQSIQNRLALPTTTTAKSLIVGREHPADIIVNLPIISGSHLEITVMNNEFMVRDLDSSNGTFINSFSVTGNDFYRLPPKGILKLGNYEVPPETIQRWLHQVIKSSTDTVKTSIPSGKNRLTIGRNPECDITIAHPQVSGFHAELLNQNGVWLLKDTKSANGTTVDGQKIIMTEVTSKSEIFIGSQQLLLQFNPEGSLDDIQLDQSGVRIEAKSIVYCWSNGQRGIDDVELSIYPGEMVALMGPSGAGKTTLLNLLAGIKKPTTGQVLFNGRSANSEFVANNIGYVPQKEDSFYTDLTVYETLYYACKLKLPSDTTESEIENRINQLLRDMDLESTRDIIIGTSGKGISGGQAKRVNIALELINEPDVLFLDEPTSGLDSTSTDKLSELLESLRDRGKTIILTIHQPRVEVFNTMKQVILMCKGGKLGYFGPPSDVEAYFSNHVGISKPEGTNPSDFMLDVMDPDRGYKAWSPIEWQMAYRESSQYQEYVTKRIMQSARQQTSLNTRLLKRSVLSQLKLTVHRYLIRKTRDVGAMRNLFVQPVIVGAILSIIFNDSWSDLVQLSDERSSDMLTFNRLLNQADSSGWVQQMAMEQSANGLHPTIFLMAAASFWFGCSNIAKELVAERKTFVREGKSGLSTSAYLGSTFGVQTLIVAVQTFIMALFAWTFVGFGHEWSLVMGWVTLVLTGMVGLSVGLLISSAAETETQAITIVPIVLLPQLMLSGYIKLFKDLSDSVTMLSSLLPIKWSFEALSIQMYKGICTELGCICNEPVPMDSIFGQSCDGDPYDEGTLTNLGDTLGFSNYSTEFNWTVSNELEALTILLLMCAFCVGITYKLLEDTKKI